MARNSPARFEPTLEATRQLLDRSYREQTNLFWAEGCRPFFAALERGWQIRAVVYSPKLLRSGAVWQSLAGLPYPTLKLSPEAFHSLSRREMPDGVGVIAEQRWSRLIDQSPGDGDVWVALDSVRIPGNLGTIVRTAVACGVKGVMLVGGELDPYDPATIRASMGALFGTQLIRTSSKALAGWKSRRIVTFLGTSPAAALDYRQAEYSTPLVVMMGSERAGLRATEIALCDEMVSLPMAAGVDSLNLAVATSVVLYEAVGRVRIASP